MNRTGLAFYHPIAFWLGCLALIAGVLAHLPMFLMAAPMGYHMAGMPMDTTMLVGMALIPVGLAMSAYGLMPRMGELSTGGDAPLFHVADRLPLNAEHWKLVLVLVVAVAVDVMKPATLGFVMPGMTDEYGISTRRAGTLALVALTGTTVGSVVWGVLADMLGRRAAILLSALMFIGTAICGAMPSFEWNLLMCFLMGLSAGGLLPIAFTLMAETIPVMHRGWLLVTLGGVGTSAGYLLAAGSAALLEPEFSWRILWMLGLPTGLLLIFLNRYIPESPRYLASKGLAREAREVLARFGEGEAATPVVVEPMPAPASGRLRDLLHGPYAGITLGLVVAGVSWGLVNFGFLLWLPTNLRAWQLSAQVDALLAQSAILAIPGIVLVVWLYQRWSSLRTLVLFMALNVLSLCLFIAFDLLEVRSAAVMVAATAALLVSASGVIAMLIPYAAEIYPVQLRGTGSGLTAAASKFGGILGALLGMAGLFDHLAGSAATICVPLAVSVVLLARHGVDTRGLRLEDIDAVVRDRHGRVIAP